MSAVKINYIDNNYSQKKATLAQPEKEEQPKGPWTEKKLASSTKHELSSQQKYLNRMNNSREQSAEKKVLSERLTPLKTNQKSAIKPQSKINTERKVSDFPASTIKRDKNEDEKAEAKSASGSKPTEATNEVNKETTEIKDFKLDENSLPKNEVDQVTQEAVSEANNNNEIKEESVILDETSTSMLQKDQN